MVQTYFPVFEFLTIKNFRLKIFRRKFLVHTYFRVNDFATIKNFRAKKVS
jgi:hypothetical protein